MVLSLSLVGCPAAGGAARDAVPTSRDVVVDAGGPRSGEGYEYVARRPLAVVALAEARGLEVEAGRLAVDRLADALDACVTEQGRQGALVEGAARAVAQIDGTGTVAGTSLRIEPGPGVAQSAALCLIAPLKLLTFPPADATARGMAIEALWGRVLPTPASSAH